MNSEIIEVVIQKFDGFGRPVSGRRVRLTMECIKDLGIQHAEQLIHKELRSVLKKTAR